MAESQRYRGLLIGNATFPRDPHALPVLNGPLDDIAELRQVLTDPQVGLFDSTDLEALPDHGIQDLRERVDDLFTTATRGDVLLLYYSGHGQLDERGILYLCANDSRTTGLRSSALSAIEINNIIDGSPATSTVVILDCCYSGAFKGTAPSAPVAGRGRYVLTSSRSTQLAQAADRPGQPSPFTRQLVRALRTAQPGKAAGHLTVAEVYRQVHHWMTADTVIAPQLRFAGEGDVAIARRPIPPHLAPLRKTEPPSATHLRPYSPDKPRAPGGTPARADTPVPGSPASPAQLAESQTTMGDRGHTPADTSEPARKPIPRRAAIAFGAAILAGSPPPGRDTKRRRRLVLSLVAVGVVVVSLAVYVGTRLPGDQNDHKGTADGKPDQTSTLKPSTDGSAGRSSDTTSAGTSATPSVAGGGSAHGGNSSSGDGAGGSSSNDTTGGSPGSASGDASGGKTTGGSGDAGGSRGSNGSSGASTPATPPASNGRFQLRDVGYGKCLAVSYSVVFATCADSPATNWTAKAGSGGSYTLYNESADQCLNVNINQLSMADCGSSGQSWRTGTSSTVVNLDSSLCLEERSGWPVMGSCEPSKSTQHWAKE